MKINLDKRLLTVFNSVKKCETAADIGTDHGFIAVKLAFDKVAEKVIATDISDKSLDKCRRLAKKFNVIDKMDFRVGEGLKPLTEKEIDTIIISGLGGAQIIRILSEGKIKCKRYVLCPQNNSVDLRKYLSNNKKNIISDNIVYLSEHFYDIIVAEEGNRKLSEREIYWGMNDLTSYDFRLYAEKIKSLKKRIEKGSAESARIKELNYILELINENN